MAHRHGGPIRTAIAGVGNCASSLVQGVSYCRAAGPDAVGVNFPELGGYAPGDIEIVAGFDVDARKVGRPIGEAVLALPNCTEIFHTALGDQQAEVCRGPDLDGVSAYMRNQPADTSFVTSDAPALSRDEVVSRLRDAGAEVLILFLPVGSREAVDFYADCALRAGCAVVNGIPVFLASNPAWAQRFSEAGLPILGDDFKAQFGATIVHRALAHLADLRGVKIDRTYQLNVGGNTDFLNMMDMDRLAMKRESKTEAVQAAMTGRLDDSDIRIGPSDYIPWLKDRKVAYVRLEGRLLGGARTSVEMRLEVEDSPNAAAMALSAIRCARIARDRGLKGPIEAASAFLFKHPPVQYDDAEAYDMLLDFANGTAPRVSAPKPAFVTGGSSGIGLEIARRLAGKGHPIALFARDRVRLEGARDSLLKTHPGAAVRLWPVDVGDRAALGAALGAAVAEMGPPGWAVASAGIAEPGEFLSQSLDAHEAQMRVNYLGSLYFSRAAADAMAGAGGGRLVFLASGAAFFGIYGYGAYAPSKFAVRGLAEVLRVELAPLGIAVTLACPPDTDTPQLAAERRLKPPVTARITGAGGMLSAEAVAQAILKGAERGRFLVAPGAQMTALAALHSVLGPVLRGWQGRIVRRTGR